MSELAQQKEYKTLCELQFLPVMEADEQWGLQFQRGPKPPTTFLRLPINHRGFNTPFATDPELPQGKDLYPTLIDRIGLSYKTGSVADHKDVGSWIHITNQDNAEEEMGPNGLFLFFDHDGNPYSWEVK